MSTQTTRYVQSSDVQAAKTEIDTFLQTEAINEIKTETLSHPHCANLECCILDPTICTVSSDSSDRAALTSLQTLLSDKYATTITNDDTLRFDGNKVQVCRVDEKIFRTDNTDDQKLQAWANALTTSEKAHPFFFECGTLTTHHIYAESAPEIHEDMTGTAFSDFEPSDTLTSEKSSVVGANANGAFMQDTSVFNMSSVTNKLYIQPLSGTQLRAHTSCIPFTGTPGLPGLKKNTNSTYYEVSGHNPQTNTVNVQEFTDYECTQKTGGDNDNFTISALGFLMGNVPLYKRTANGSFEAIV